MLTFVHAITAGEPVWLCEDLRRHIVAMHKARFCKRCRAMVSSGRDRVRMCYTHEGLLCFTCHHRLRWPRA